MATSPPSKNTHLSQHPEKQTQLKEEEKEEEEEENQKTQHQHPNHHHLCDFCNKSIPLLYCRADSAKLCFSCDRSVHIDNPLFSKHLRSHLCNSCNSNPSSIHCSTHNLFLCQNCDWDAHDRQAPAHDRRPLEGFSGCPSAIEFASVLGFEDKVLLIGNEDNEDGEDWGVDGFLDGWLWETTAPVISSSLDGLIVPGTVASSYYNFQAMGFPPAIKHRNVQCGKHKDEILRQLRGLIKTETHLNNDGEKLNSVHGLQCWGPEQNLLPRNMGTEFENDAVPIVVPGCEASALQMNGNSCEATDQLSFYYNHSLESNIEESLLVLEGKTDVHGSRSHINGDNIEQHPSFEEIPFLQPQRVYELTGHDRDSVISRYKEKKKTRRYDRHIRYESRKVRADSRIRIKGRFAKVNQDQSVGSVLRQLLE